MSVVDTILAATILRDAGCPPTTEQLANALDAAVREPPDPEPVHWVGDAPTSLHGNGAASFGRSVRDAAEVTCTLLARPESHDARCLDLTPSPRGPLRCILPVGHEIDPLSLHHIDPSRGPESHYSEPREVDHG